ncbi:MAG: chorismate mutase, partial [Pseudomonadota bacterium]
MTKEISELRASIDAIDDKIITLLNERSKIVKTVGMTKKQRQKDGMAFIRSGREADVIKRIYNSFNNGIFPAEAAVHIWRMVICASLSLESQLIISVNKQDIEAIVLANSYFGSFTPINTHASNQEVINDLISGKAEVGVFTINQRNN